MFIYRYTSNAYSLLDEEGVFSMYKKPVVQLHKYIVSRETKCFYFIKIPYTLKEKKVSKTAKSTFAYDTKDKAMVNYKNRCRRNVFYCDRAYKIAKIFWMNSLELEVND